MYLWLLVSLLKSILCSQDVMELRMPGVEVTKSDTYLHLTLSLEDVIYVTGYSAEADSGTAHHIILFGCLLPTNSVGGVTDGHGKAPCSSGESVLWAWGLDAPAFTLPANVSVQAGGKSSVRYLVLEVHYKDAQENRDSSGVDVLYQRDPTPYKAGVYVLLSPEGEIPPGLKHVSLDVGCNYTATPINIFAFRTHAHAHSTMITGYRAHNGTWYEIGSRDPQLPQMFTRTTTVEVVKPGDQLYARCEYSSLGLNTSVRIGATHLDEMCNFYIMYYTEMGEELEREEDRTCAQNTHFTVPPYLVKKEAIWYEAYISPQALLYLFICILCLLIAGPIYTCIRGASQKSSYKRPNDGFEKLFGPDEDEEEEDEILYKSYKNSY